MNKFFEPYKLTLAQRLFLVPYYSLASVINPYNGDNIAGLGDATNVLVIKDLKSRFERTSHGKELLRYKPTIAKKSLNVELLRQLPIQTLGRHYIDYMDQHEFSPDERSIVKYQLDPDLAYVMCRYRQVHDFWHALSGLPPTILGELVLKAFEFQVTGLPVCILGSTVGQIRLSRAELIKFYTIGLPWAISAGKRCSQSYLKNPNFDVLTYHYEKNLEKEVDEVRRELDFNRAPALH